MARSKKSGVKFSDVNHWKKGALTGSSGLARKVERKPTAGGCSVASARIGPHTLSPSSSPVICRGGIVDAVWSISNFS